MDLRICNNELVNVPDGFKTLFLARTARSDTACYFVAVIVLDLSTPTQGSTNTFYRELLEATIALFDANGACMRAFSPYSAREYVEKDALRVIEFERNGRSLRWTTSKWCPTAGKRIEYKWCEFLGTRIEPPDIFVAL